jgi:tetratricopeptide (TPR) repeat protein
MSINEEASRLLEKGQRLFEENHHDKAFEMFDAAIRLDPVFAPAYLVKAEAHMEMMEMEEAEQCIKTYLKFDPESERACSDLMDIYYESGEFDESLAYCDRLLVSNSRDPYLCAIKAYLLSHLDKVDESLEYYDKAIDLKPDFYDAVCDKASLLSECGCHSESLEVYQDGIRIEPGKAEAYFGAACACERLGYKKKARLYIEKAKELEPEDEFYKIHFQLMQ